MKKIVRAAALSAAVLLMTGSFAACSAKDKYGLVADGKLTMGTNAQFPPFEYVENGSYAGVDVEIMETIAKKLDLTLEVKDMDFDSLPASINAKEIDVIGAGYTADSEREEKMDFSDSYYTALQTIIVRSESAYAKLSDLENKGLKIGGQGGTTGLSCAEKLTDKDNVKAYNNGAMAVEDLLNGNLDAVIIDNNPAKEYKSIHGDKIKLLEKQFDEEYYVFGVQKGNKALQEAINKALKEMKDDGSFQKIIDKHIK